MSVRQKHTPGPWAVHPGCAQVDAFTPTPVAVCRLLWPTDVRGEEETEANARLIAAAPDLLAALDGLLHEVGDYLTQDRQAYIDAVAAIDKAKGQA